MLRARYFNLMRAVLVLAAVFSPSQFIWADCYTAVVPSTVVLPDGSVHPPGSLRICNRVMLSPVAGLHDIYVNGQPVGKFRSRLGRSEGTGDGEEALFAFMRDRDSQLRLHGYAFLDGDRYTIYDLTSTRYGAQALEQGTERGNAEPLVRIAGNRYRPARRATY